MTVKGWAEVLVGTAVLPAVLATGVLAAGICAGQVWPKARTAAYGGFWAGVLLFLAFVLGLTHIELGALPGRPDWLPPLGAVVGFGLGTWTTRFFLRLRADPRVAMPLAWQCFGALALLYLYVVWVEAREYIGWLALGIALSSSVFYALGRDLPPHVRRRPERGSKAASQVAGPWYQPGQEPLTPQPPDSPAESGSSPRRLGTRRRLAPPTRATPPADVQDPLAVDQAPQ